MEAVSGEARPGDMPRQRRGRARGGEFTKRAGYSEEQRLVENLKQEIRLASLRLKRLETAISVCDVDLQRMRRQWGLPNGG